MRRLLLLALLVCVLGAGCGGSRLCTLEVILRAVPQHGERLTPQGIEVARDIITSRLATLGVADPIVSTRGSDEIFVELPGTRVAKDLAGIVSATGDLQFFDFEQALAPPTVTNGAPTPYPSLYSLLTAVKGAASTGTPEAYYLFQGDAQHGVMAGPAGTKSALTQGYTAGELAHATILAVPANREVVSGPVETPATRPVKRSPDGVYWYLFKLPAALSGGDIRESQVRAGTDPNTGVPHVALVFTAHGAKEFEAITKAEYERGRLAAGPHGSTGVIDMRYAQHSAIVLDGKLQAAPFIDYTDAALSLGISGGYAVIDNMASLQAARNLALVLRSGSLPYVFERVIVTSLCSG